MQQVPDSFVDRQVGTEATRRAQFIKNSTKRVAKGSTNEEQYQRQHIAESMRRMTAAQLMDFSRQMTPEGGYWLLDHAAKSHTPDCRAMSNKNWSWEMLATVNPASLHAGCRCRIIPALSGARWGRTVPKAVVHELAEADIIELNGVEGVWRKMRGVNVFIGRDGRIIAGPDDLKGMKVGEKVSAKIKDKPNMNRRGFRPATADERAALKVPPEYTDVIVPTAKRTIFKFIALDGTNKRQYRYTDAYAAKKAKEKFRRISRIIEMTPQVRKDALARAKKGDDAALALIWMIDSGMRIGGKSDGRSEAVGASTLMKSNLKVRGDYVMVDAIVKGGKRFQQMIYSAEVAAVLGARMKGMKSGDQVFSANDASIRRLVKELAGDEYKAHDFRTQFATSRAIEMITQMPIPENDKQRTQQVREVARAISDLLGNTPKVAQESYIMPEVWEMWGEKR
jgi:DNA topoisomerase-1